MSRLIDADALKESLGELRSAFNCFDDTERAMYVAYSMAISKINDMPTVDICEACNADVYGAVEVVRCGECRWFDRGEASGTVEPIGYRCKRGCRFVDADDFCKYGERREG